ncbi:hypothetical protein DFH27DRAFT_166762 [Peziza echinospora]|nr:hypothetical protein DFH27DRAFT_166762 [Peziza echinospora]
MAETTVTPTRSLFYAVLIRNQHHTGTIHLCGVPPSNDTRPAYQAVVSYIWRLWYQIRRAFEMAFLICQRNNPENSLWQGCKFTQDFINGATGRNASRLCFRSTFAPGRIDPASARIQPGMHWINALKQNEGLGIEMGFVSYKQSSQDPNAPTELGDVEITARVQCVEFHACEEIMRRYAWDSLSVDALHGWFQIDLGYVTNPAFPQAAYEAAFLPRPPPTPVQRSRSMTPVCDLAEYDACGPNDSMEMTQPNIELCFHDNFEVIE